MRILFVLGVLTGGWVWAAGAPVLQDGQREMTSKTVVAGMPVSMPEQTISLCLKKEDIARGDLPAGAMQSGQCRTLESKVSGSTYNYKMVCTADGTTSTITGSMQYSRTSYQGKSVVETNASGQAMKISNEYRAKRTGDCPR